MHSIRMRTVRSSSRREGGLSARGGVCPGVGGCLPRVGVSAWGVVSQHALRQTPPPPTEFLTHATSLWTVINITFGNTTRNFFFQAYGKTFIHKVKHKHTLARNYFSRLPGMAEHLRRDASAKSQASSQGPSITGKAVPIKVT